jgi:hypothetical protein
MGRSLHDRFWEKVDIRGDDECWEWTGAVFRAGYGSIVVDRANRYAHRVAWVMHVGQPVPDGLVVMHACDNKRCVNPAHLSVGTQGDNLRDAKAKGRTRKVPQPGEENPAAVLTDARVRMIRAEFAASGGRRGVRTLLGRKYGVSRTMISYIVEGRNWKHV